MQIPIFLFLSQKQVSSFQLAYTWLYIRCVRTGSDQSLIKESLSTRPNTDLQIRSSKNFHYAKIVALIEGEDWNAIGTPADHCVNNSQGSHTHKEKHIFVWR